MSRINTARALRKKMDEAGLSIDDLCVVGSSALEDLAPSSPADIDIVVNPDVNSSKIDGSRINLGGNWKTIEVVRDNAASFGISDSCIVNSYSEEIRGVRFMYPELALARKIFVRRAKDDLFLRDVSADSLVSAGVDADFLAELLHKANQLNQSPKRLVSIFRRLLSDPRSTVAELVSYSTINLVSRRKSRKVKRTDLVAYSLLQIDVGQLIALQGNSSLERSERVDLPVRFCAAREILTELATEKKDPKFAGNWIDHYSLMQLARKGESENYLSSFVDLVMSMKRNAFQQSNPIVLDERGRLHDGAHRLATALALGLDSISAKVIAGTRQRNFGFSWFEKNMPSLQPSDLQTANLSMLRASGNLWPIIFWPDALKSGRSKELAVQQLSVAGGLIVEELDLAFDRKTFKEFVIRVYETDEVQAWKTFLKLRQFERHFSDTRVKVWVCALPNGHLRRKKSKTSLQSIPALELKSNLRKTLKKLSISYFFDSIVHIGDNQKQNRQLLAVLDSFRDKPQGTAR